MNYQIRGLEPALFEQLFDLDDATLAERDMRRVRSDQPVGYPCRISLEDAPVGEELLLLPFTHQDGATPFRASGPIFVRRGQAQAARIVNQLPVCLTLRPLSVRAYDAADEMVDAEVVDGREARRSSNATSRARMSPTCTSTSRGAAASPAASTAPNKKVTLTFSLA